MKTLRAVCLLVVAMVGCVPTTENCTLIGCLNGLMVRLEGAPAGPWTVQVTSGNTTRTQECPAGGNCAGQVFFSGLEPTTVNVTVTRGANSVTYNNLTPTANTVQPNGPRCAPTCNQPFVTVAPPAP